MASGSYARKTVQEFPLEERVTRIPPRATRQLQIPKESIQEDYDNTPETVPVTAPSRLLVQPNRPKVIQQKLLPPQAEVAPIGPPLQPAMPIRYKGKATSDYGRTTIAPKAKRWAIWLVLSIIFLAVFLSAGIFQRPLSSYIANGGQAYDHPDSWEQDHPMPPQTPITPQSGPYAVLGKPSINPDFINQVLSTYKSPAAGKGQSLYDLGIKYGIDPAFALAFFMHESSFGTQGEATKSLSLGNLRCIPNFRCEDNFAQFNNWEDGFQAWYQLIRNWYVAVKGLTTVDQIIPVYAPPADNNNDNAYIAALKHAIDTWHAGQIIVG
jgi:hypothetical protein